MENSTLSEIYIQENTDQIKSSLDECFVFIVSFKDNKKYFHENILEEIRKVLSFANYKELDSIVFEYNILYQSENVFDYEPGIYAYENYLKFRNNLNENELKNLDRILKKRESKEKTESKL